jgi:hypothetical protein
VVWTKKTKPPLSGILLDSATKQFPTLIVDLECPIRGENQLPIQLLVNTFHLLVDRFECIKPFIIQ